MEMLMKIVAAVVVRRGVNDEVGLGGGVGVVSYPAPPTKKSRVWSNAS